MWRRCNPSRLARDALKVERNLRAEADRLRAALAESAHELHSTPADVERVVRVGLELGRQSALQPVSDTHTGHTVWRVPPLTGSWARTTVDLVDRDYGARPISFDGSLAAKRDDVVLAHLNHPLVAMATRLLRAEVWGAGHLERAASLVVDDPTLTEPVLAAYSRLVLVGADGKRLHEELFAAGGRVRGDSFSRLGVTALAAPARRSPRPGLLPRESSPAAKEDLVRSWPKVSRQPRGGDHRTREGAGNLTDNVPRQATGGRADPHRRTAVRVREVAAGRTGRAGPGAAAVLRRPPTRRTRSARPRTDRRGSNVSTHCPASGTPRSPRSPVATPRCRCCGSPQRSCTSFPRSGTDDPARGRRSRTPGQSSTTEWLELLAVDGPFLAAPVVKDVWPGGLPALNKDDVGALREASSVLDASPGTRDAFIRHVLTSFLGWKSNLVGAGHVPPTLTTPVPEYGTEVRPDFALLTDPDDPASAPLLLGIVVDPGVRATARPRPGTPGTDKWPASFADRLGHALRARRVPLGLVTDGTEWTLVCAPAGGATTTATWTRHTWFDEPDTLKAFAALLGRLRFFGVPEDQTLPALLAASLDRQEEITTRLSEQSRSVVEMLVATIGRLDAEHRAQHGEPLLPATVGPAEVYQGAVTVLMRVVFLLYAEERGLLRVDDDTYADAYAISTLAGQLHERASDAGEDTLERSTTAWHRMLATFRAVHRGARHDQLTLPGYGGSLFDPDRFPWLEGRPDAGAGLEDADPLHIDDRTLLRALEALQWLRFAGERRRVSFRVLDVEQIGYVYEGLLDQDARRAHDWILGIAGDSRGEKDGPEVPLTDLIEHLDQGAEHFATWLSGEIKEGNGNRSPAAITKALTAPTGAAADTAWTGVLEACGGDEATARSIMPFAGLLRRDPRDLPVIYPPGSLYLTDSELRAHTGAVYTPRALAEEVVARTLEPLVKSPGPLDTEDEATWRIRTPEQILALKVIDIAAGSGAFLVGATRYLADRLLDAKRAHEPDQTGVEVDDEQAVIDARRQILDHCIYGIDINPMALEMAKLSLWLVTLDQNRPFGFLDDRLAVGDSLLGLTSPEQLLDMHLDPREGRKARNHEQIAAYTADVPGLLKQSAALRQRIADVDLIDSHSAEHKARLLAESQELTQRLTVLADALSGASLSGGTAGHTGKWRPASGWPPAARAAIQRGRNFRKTPGSLSPTNADNSGAQRTSRCCSLKCSPRHGPDSTQSSATRRFLAARS